MHQDAGDSRARPSSSPRTIPSSSRMPTRPSTSATACWSDITGGAADDAVQDRVAQHPAQPAPLGRRPGSRSRSARWRSSSSAPSQATSSPGSRRSAVQRSATSPSFATAISLYGAGNPAAYGIDDYQGVMHLHRRRPRACADDPRHDADALALRHRRQFHRRQRRGQDLLRHGRHSVRPRAHAAMERLWECRALCGRQASRGRRRSEGAHRQRPRPHPRSLRPAQDRQLPAAADHRRGREAALGAQGGFQRPGARRHRRRSRMRLRACRASIFSPRPRAARPMW